MPAIQSLQLHITSEYRQAITYYFGTAGSEEFSYTKLAASYSYAVAFGAPVLHIAKGLFSQPQSGKQGYFEV